MTDLVTWRSTQATAETGKHGHCCPEDNRENIVEQRYGSLNLVNTQSLNIGH